MPFVIQDGVKKEFVKVGITLPEELEKLLQEERVIPGTKKKVPLSNVIADAVEFYYAAKDKLPKDYVMSAEAERVREAMKAHAKATKKSGR